MTKSDWMIQIYNMNKYMKQTFKDYMKGDFCNLDSCKLYTDCKCDKFIDNLIDDKCKFCNHNVLNHCKTYNDIL